MFKEVSRAYEVLGSPNGRKLYDADHVNGTKSPGHGGSAYTYVPPGAYKPQQRRSSNFMARSKPTTPQATPRYYSPEELEAQRQKERERNAAMAQRLASVRAQQNERHHQQYARRVKQFETVEAFQQEEWSRQQQCDVRARVQASTRLYENASAMLKQFQKERSQSWVGVVEKEREKFFKKKMRGAASRTGTPVSPVEDLSVEDSEAAARAAIEDVDVCQREDVLLNFKSRRSFIRYIGVSTSDVVLEETRGRYDIEQDVLQFFVVLAPVWRNESRSRGMTARREATTRQSLEATVREMILNVTQIDALCSAEQDARRELSRGMLMCHDLEGREAVARRVLWHEEARAWAKLWVPYQFLRGSAEEAKAHHRSAAHSCALRRSSSSLYSSGAPTPTTTSGRGGPNSPSISMSAFAEEVSMLIATEADARRVICECERLATDDMVEAHQTFCRWEHEDHHTRHIDRRRGVIQDLKEAAVERARVHAGAVLLRQELLSAVQGNTVAEGVLLRFEAEALLRQNNILQRMVKCLDRGGRSNAGGGGVPPPMATSTTTERMRHLNRCIMDDNSRLLQENARLKSKLGMGSKQHSSASIKEGTS